MLNVTITTAHNCVISRTAERWFIAIRYQTSTPIAEVERLPVGVDVGIKELGVCSNGQVFANSKAYRQMSKKLKR